MCIGDVILAKMLMTATEYVLALATLGDATKNRNNPIFCCAAHEQWSLSLVAVAGIIALDFANVNTANVSMKMKCCKYVNMAPHLLSLTL